MKIEVGVYLRSFLSLLYSLGNISFICWTLIQIFARAFHIKLLNAYSKKRIDAISQKPSFIMIRDRGLRFRVYPTFKDIYVAKLLYERPVSKVVLRFKPSIFINVGAHIGTYAIRFAARNARVLAVEPDYRSYSLLRTNARMNHVEDKVNAQNVVAYSRKGKSSFYLRRSPIYSSIYGSGDYLEERQVETCPLDVIAGSFGEVDLMLIDVEGSEAEVLKGANKVLEKTRRLVIEVGYRNEKEVIEILKRHDFELTPIHCGGNFVYYLCVRNGERVR